MLSLQKVIFCCLTFSIVCCVFCFFYVFTQLYLLLNPMYVIVMFENVSGHLITEVFTHLSALVCSTNLKIISGSSVCQMLNLLQFPYKLYLSFNVMAGKLHLVCLSFFAGNCCFWSVSKYKFALYIFFFCLRNKHFACVMLFHHLSCMQLKVYSLQSSLQLLAISFCPSQTCSCFQKKSCLHYSSLSVCGISPFFQRKPRLLAMGDG